MTRLSSYINLDQSTPRFCCCCCYTKIIKPYLFQLLRQGFLLPLNILLTNTESWSRGRNTGLEAFARVQIRDEKNLDQNGSNGLGAKIQDTLSEQLPHEYQELLFTYSGPLNPPAFEALERLKGGDVWGGFLESVDLHKSVNVRQKTTLFLEESSLFQSCFLCTCSLHLLIRDIPTSWAAECTHSVGGRWKSQSSHFWLTWAALAGRLLASCHFGSREAQLLLGEPLFVAS